MINNEQIEALLQQITIEDNETTRNARKNLIQIGEPAAEYLVDLLLKTTHIERVTVSQVLIFQLLADMSPSPNLSRKLVQILRQADDNTGLYFYGLFATFKDENTIQLLITNLHDDTVGEQRKWIALALGQTGAKSAVSHLTKIVADENEVLSVRSSAASALGRIGDAKAAPAIKKLVDTIIEINFWHSLVLALGETGNHDDGEYLINLLSETQDSRKQGAIIDALGRMEYIGAVQHIIPFLQSDNKTVQFAAIQALGFIGDKQAIQSLEQLRLSLSSHEHRWIDMALKNIKRGGRKKRK